MLNFRGPLKFNSVGGRLSYISRRDIITFSTEMDKASIFMYVASGFLKKNIQNSRSYNEFSKGDGVLKMLEDVGNTVQIPSLRC